MSLTSKSREYWSHRVEELINQRIHALETQDPERFRDLRIQALQEASEAFGITSVFEQVDALEAQREELHKKSNAIVDDLFKKLFPGESEVHLYSKRKRIDEFVHSRSKPFEERLLSTDSLGKQMLDLARLKSSSSDEIALASSLKEIKDIWSSLSIDAG